MDVPAVLKVIDEVVNQPAFVTTCKEFVDKNCDVFSDDLENRLEYTVRCPPVARSVSRRCRPRRRRRRNPRWSGLSRRWLPLASASAHPRGVCERGGGAHRH